MHLFLDNTLLALESAMIKVKCSAPTVWLKVDRTPISGPTAMAVQVLVAHGPLKDSTKPFCHGDPGSMKIVSASLNRHQSATA